MKNPTEPLPLLIHISLLPFKDLAGRKVSFRGSKTSRFGARLVMGSMGYGYGRCSDLEREGCPSDYECKPESRFRKITLPVLGEKSTDAFHTVKKDGSGLRGKRQLGLISGMRRYELIDMPSHHMAKRGMGMAKHAAQPSPESDKAWPFELS
ncbi:hypothetical protein HYFRA_00003926 [Hymenoscyphus fraxineus]|uniref:Uncharacterized protein n=1 Tax=Hymenoscyphus fraxineus TaxID=746836 RepID=A0A9N9L1G1_9HELO|nr:hypothetical protein HYFRA_00003926 [Hymenoscyphus fraxineus]